MIEFCSYEDLKKENRLNIDELVKPNRNSESDTNDSKEQKIKLNAKCKSFTNSFWSKTISVFIKLKGDVIFLTQN